MCGCGWVWVPRGECVCVGECGSLGVSVCVCVWAGGECVCVGRGECVCVCGEVAYSWVPVLVVSTLGQCTVESCQDPERNQTKVDQLLQ